VSVAANTRTASAAAWTTEVDDAPASLSTSGDLVAVAGAAGPAWVLGLPTGERVGDFSVSAATTWMVLPRPGDDALVSAPADGDVEHAAVTVRAATATTVGMAQRVARRARSVRMMLDLVNS
jgi:hypothetical protein